jgi:hypothetical protein
MSKHTVVSKRAFCCRAAALASPAQAHHADHALEFWFGWELLLLGNKHPLAFIPATAALTLQPDGLLLHVELDAEAIQVCLFFHGMCLPVARGQRCSCSVDR